MVHLALSTLIGLTLAWIAPATAILPYKAEVEMRPSWLDLVPTPVTYFMRPGQCVGYLSLQRKSLCAGLSAPGFAVVTSDTALLDDLEVDDDMHGMTRTQVVTIWRQEVNGKCPDEYLYAKVKARCSFYKDNDEKRFGKHPKKKFEKIPAVRPPQPRSRLEE